MGYVAQGSSIGKCRGCGQRHELHTGGYCETCIREKELYIETSPSKEGGSFSEPSGDTNGRPQASNPKRDGYLEYIVSNATDEFIDKYLDDWKADMRSSMGWVDELKKETEDLKLMRIAASLGMGKKVKQPTKEELRAKWYEDRANVNALPGMLVSIPFQEIPKEMRTPEEEKQVQSELEKGITLEDIYGGNKPIKRPIRKTGNRVPKTKKG